MRKIKLFKYDFAPPHIHDSIKGYENTVPFSQEGIAKWCELVDPKDAEVFYCGQYADKDRWMLNPERFEYFKGNESKHVFDLEGDQSHLSFLPWMRSCIITAMNAEPNHRNWNCFVRPGCSTLLMDMVRNPRPYMEPEKVGFFFMGQRDPNGLREKVREAFIKADVPGEFIWTSKWNAPSSLEDQDVREYEEGLKRWSFALCPAGTGQMTVRFFEACALGRIPIVIADNLLFCDSLMSFAIRESTGVGVDIMARWISRLPDIAQTRYLTLSYGFFHNFISEYFLDPTLFLLRKLTDSGFIVI